MQIFRSKVAFVSYREALPPALRIGFVATMGGLHEGHLSLIRASARFVDLTIVSLYVNPTQFAANEDFSVYPRNEKNDRALVQAAGADVMFIPRERDIYPGGRHVYITAPELTPLYCGVIRPHFFSGGMTVVAKFLNIIRPHVAYFGKKDYQQLFLFRQMVRELAFPVKIVGIATVREKSGLALSSRNVYLSVKERELASAFYRALQSVREYVSTSGEISFQATRLVKHFHATLHAAPFLRPDYVTWADRKTLLPTKIVHKGRSVLLAAVFFRAEKTAKPKVRLIDNIEI